MVFQPQMQPEFRADEADQLHEVDGGIRRGIYRQRISQRPTRWPPMARRYVMENAFERYMANHQLYTLAKVEDPTLDGFPHQCSGQETGGGARKLSGSDRRRERYMNARIYNRVWGGCLLWIARPAVGELQVEVQRISHSARLSGAYGGCWESSRPPARHENQFHFDERRACRAERA